MRLLFSISVTSASFSEANARPQRCGRLLLFLPFRGHDVPVTDVDLKRFCNAAGTRSFPPPPQSEGKAKEIATLAPPGSPGGHTSNYRSFHGILGLASGTGRPCDSRQSGLG